MDFVGIKNLHIAEVTTDTEESYETGTPTRLTRIAEISQTTEQAQNVVYYDDVAAYAVNSLGATTLNVTGEGLSLENLAKVMGATIENGMLVDSGEPSVKSYAVSFEADYVGGGTRYYNFLKCSISVPDESSKSKDAGTDTTNQTLTITCINTTHKFASTGKTCKRIISDTATAEGEIDLSKWYKQVITPDNAATEFAVTQ